MKFAQIASIFNFKNPQTDPVDFKEPLAKWQTVKQTGLHILKIVV